VDFSLDSFQGQLDKLNKLPRTYRLAMLPAIVVVVAAVYIYFLYLPAKQELNSARDQHLQMQRSWPRCERSRATRRP